MTRIEKLQMKVTPPVGGSWRPGLPLPLAAPGLCRVPLQPWQRPRRPQESQEGQIQHHHLIIRIFLVKRIRYRQDKS